MKISELFEGRVKQMAYDREFDNTHSREPVGFNVMINGKIWTKNGEPVHFKDHSSALHAANTITAKRNITTQVVPIKK